MLKLLKKFSIFITPVIIVVLFFEYNLAKIPTSYGLKKDYLDKNASKIQILVLGSSHTFSAINPDFLSMSGFNAAAPSQSLYYDLKMFDKYADKLTNLKKLIIPVSYFSLEYNFSSSAEAWLEYFYKRIYGITPEFSQSNMDLRNFSFLALYGQPKSIYYASQRFKVNLAKNTSELGYLIDNNNNVSEESGKIRVAIQESMMDEENINKNINYLEQMIKLAKSRGIEPIIITTPVYSTLSGNINMDKYNLMQNTVKNLAEKYNIQYLNYFFDKRFSASDFSNNDHLNAPGAEKFTKILDEDLKNQSATY